MTCGHLLLFAPITGETCSRNDAFCTQAGGSSAPAASSGSNASAATEVFLREDSRGSLDSSANAAGGTGNSLGFRSRKPGTPVRAAGSSGNGRSSKGAFGSGRQDCKLGALHRHYQALCKQVRYQAGSTGKSAYRLPPCCWVNPMKDRCQVSFAGAPSSTQTAGKLLCRVLTKVRWS